MLSERNDLRNIAIVAHVDHGKTTLVDGMLKEALVFRKNQQITERVMDSHDLERERGITILAKNTAIIIHDRKTKTPVKVNIVDTPGHADFGGEVERVMNMVDGILLLVDAVEGPMPQTRFVLKRALQMGHCAIVVINKMDRRDANPDRAVNAAFDLFIELGASERQADFPIIYANALTGQAGTDPNQLGPDLQPLFNAILSNIPAPRADPDAPLQMLVTNLGYDEYRGTTALGRIFAGRMAPGQRVARIELDGRITPERVRYLYVHRGLEKVEVEMAEGGEIVAIAGLTAIAIGETIADPANPVALPPIRVEEPTVRMTFGVNTSPFGGREGRWGTSRKLRERLFDQLRHDVALRVAETDTMDNFLVSGRGELHLAILIENMRREGYEFEVSRPEAIFKKGSNGEVLEPYEELRIETSSDTTGTVVEMLGKRRGQMDEMISTGDNSVHLTFTVPTRGLLGFRYQFLTATRGMGSMNAVPKGYRPFAGPIASRTTNSLVACETGVTTTYGLKNAEGRGILFLGPGVEVYEGMVIGETQRGSSDIPINVCKKKHLTNIRSSTQDIMIRLTPPRNMSLDEAIEYLVDEELLEVTPRSFRIRERILATRKRHKHIKRAAKGDNGAK